MFEAQHLWEGKMSLFRKMSWLLRRAALVPAWSAASTLAWCTDDFLNWVSLRASQENHSSCYSSWKDLSRARGNSSQALNTCKISTWGALVTRSAKNRVGRLCDAWARSWCCSLCGSLHGKACRKGTVALPTWPGSSDIHSTECHVL